MRAVKYIVAVLAIVGSLLALIWAFLVPRAIDREIRERLARAGFHDARFSIGNVALDHVEVLDMTLGGGISLGDIDIESGPYQLWRGRPADVVLHGPRVDVRTMVGGTSGARLPFRRVIVDGGELISGDDRITIEGTIDLRGPVARVALVAHARELAIGSLRAEDVGVTIRGPADDLHVCATGRLERAQVDACARIVSVNHELAIAGGVVNAALDTRVIGGLKLEDAVVHASFEGRPGSFSLRGALRARNVTTETVTLGNASVAFDLSGVLAGERVALRSDAAMVLVAESATVSALGNEVRISSPVITARGTARSSVFELTAAEAADTLQLVTTLRGVPLDRVLTSATHKRVRATGLLDGDLVFELDDGDLALVGGSLAARSPGHLAITALVTDADTNLAVHKRITAALSDFDYARLVLTVANDPELHLALAGRGRRVPQELDIDVNVRGLLARSKEPR